MQKISVLQTGPLGVNTYIVSLTENDCLVIDSAACAFTHDENAVLDFLKNHNQKAVALFATHHHFDHITGFAVLKKNFPNAHLACHKNDSSAFSQSYDEWVSDLSEFGISQFAAAMKDLPAVDYEFQGGETLDAVYKNITDEKIKRALSEWRIIHTPGHSEGSVCLYNQNDKSLISGDTIFYHTYGRTDLAGSDDAKMQTSLALIKNTIPHDTLVYPGHELYGFPLSENF